MNSQYTECKKCVLNTNDALDITFDENGICNYCHSYDLAVKKLGSYETRKKWLSDKVAEMKYQNKIKTYDCILGVSGGVDSTYLAYWCKQNNLRPLIVHFDNGWNSELAVKNIENICSILGFQLHTYVINWEEFKELQLAYLKAGVIDIEVLTDHAIYTTLVKISKKYNIKYILSGYNLATEAIMPKGWVYDKLDWENIKDIYKKHGSNTSIRTFPHISFWEKLYNYWFLKIEIVQVLNYINYIKTDAKELITKELNWNDYSGKHYESIFTKFYQSYILPVKFGVDKRKAHFSTLICSGQMTKEEALKNLSLPLYDTKTIKEEKEYVLKKLGMNEKYFDELMTLKPKDHSEFKTEKNLWNKYFKLISILKCRKSP